MSEVQESREGGAAGGKQASGLRCRGFRSSRGGLGFKGLTSQMLGFTLQRTEVGHRPAITLISILVPKNPETVQPAQPLKPNIAGLSTPPETPPPETPPPAPAETPAATGWTNINRQPAPTSVCLPQQVACAHRAGVQAGAATLLQQGCVEGGSEGGGGGGGWEDGSTCAQAGAGGQALTDCSGGREAVWLREAEAYAHGGWGA